MKKFKNLKNFQKNKKVLFFFSRCNLVDLPTPERRRLSGGGEGGHAGGMARMEDLWSDMLEMPQRPKRNFKVFFNFEISFLAATRRGLRPRELRTTPGRKKVGGKGKSLRCTVYNMFIKREKKNVKNRKNVKFKNFLTKSVKKIIKF